VPRDARESLLPCGIVAFRLYLSYKSPAASIFHLISRQSRYLAMTPAKRSGRPPSMASRHVIAKISGIVLISGAAEDRFYAIAAMHASLLRQHVLISETRPRFEADWTNLAERLRPNIPLLICLQAKAGCMM
jgi:hypothetical protein